MWLEYLLLGTFWKASPQRALSHQCLGPCLGQQKELLQLLICAVPISQVQKVDDYFYTSCEQQNPRARAGSR